MRLTDRALVRDQKWGSCLHASPSVVAAPAARARPKAYNQKWGACLQASILFPDERLGTSSQVYEAHAHASLPPHPTSGPAIAAFLAAGAEALVLQEVRLKPEDKAQCESALR